MKYANIYIPLVLFIISFSVFIPSLNNNFVWDDVSMIEKSSRYFKQLRLEQILVPKETEQKNFKYYRPAFQISVYADYQLWGVNPFGYHLTNNILFSLSVVAFYFFSLLALKQFSVGYPEKYAVVSSVLFLLHPMHVESVSWIAGRTDILCALFMLLAFISHVISFRRTILIVVTTTLFYTSMLSKEVALAFPLVVIFFDLLTRRFGKRNMGFYLVYISAAALFLYLKSRSYINVPPVDDGITNAGASAAAATSIDHMALITTFFNSYFFYIYKLVLPVQFNAYIAQVPGGLSYFAPAVLILLFLLVISAVSYFRNKGLITFSVLWTLATLGPSVLVAVFTIAATPLAERYLFIPSAGFCLLLGYVFSMLDEKRRYRLVALGLLLTIIILYATLNLQRQGVWEDRLSLWKDTSEKSFYTAFAHSNYGRALHDEKRYEEALQQYRIALEPQVNDTKTGRAITANNLSLVFIEQQQYKKAEYWLYKAKEYDPEYLNTYYHLGLVNYIRGEMSGSDSAYSNAEKLLKKVVNKSPGHAKARLLLANVYIALGEIDKAKENAERAKRRINDPELLMEAEKILKIDNNTGQQEPHKD